MEFRKTLLLIGAQHPAWSANPNDNLVRIFNAVTAQAREAVCAVGKDDDEKADWCAAEAEKRTNVDRNDALAALDRCAFLLWKISQGDHKALENAEDAAREAAGILTALGHADEWMEALAD